MTSPTTPLPPAPPAAGRYRAGVAVRALAAIGGGYLLSSLVVRALAVVLPFADVDAVVAATLAGLVVYPVAVMWTFATASAWRACLGIAALCAVLTLSLLAAHALGGGT